MLLEGRQGQLLIRNQWTTMIVESFAHWVGPSSLLILLTPPIGSENRASTKVATWESGPWMAQDTLNGFHTHTHFRSSRQVQVRPWAVGEAHF